MLRTTLVIFGVAVLAASLLHIILGPGADVLLGAEHSAITLKDPVLDSQNRFYGAAFALYGVLLIFCSTDLARYKPVLYFIISTFFFAGLARFISVVATGWPPLPVGVLFAAELIVPPVLLYWLRCSHVQ